MVKVQIFWALANMAINAVSIVTAIKVAKEYL